MLVGRADKKYCSDYCRNLFNNTINSNTNNLMRNINNILRRNRRILLEFNENINAIRSRKNLLEYGFNFNYFTHKLKNNKGEELYYCYDLGYIPKGNEEFKIIRSIEEL